MGLNREEKDFLGQLGAGIVQASQNHLERIKLENAAHIAQMQKVTGFDEVRDNMRRMEARLIRLERQTIFDRIANIFRAKDSV